MPFDPDAFLAATSPKDTTGFDPDVFLAAGKKAPDRGFGTGIGLGVRSMVEGAAALPGAAINAAYGAYNLGADAMQGKGNGARLQNFGDTVSQALTKWGLPQAETDGERLGSAIIQGASGGLGGVGLGNAVGRSASPIAQGLASVLGESAPVRNMAAGGSVGGTVEMMNQQGAPPASQLAAGLMAGAVTHSGPAAARSVGRAGAATMRNAMAARLAQPLGAEEAGLVHQYEQMGGHLRPGQYSSSNLMRQGDAVMADTPWPRVSGFRENHQTRAPSAQQADEYNRFLSQTFGGDSPRITDQVLRDAAARIGRVYEEVLPRNSVRMDDELSGAMAALDNRIAEALPAMDAADATRIGAVMNRMRGLLDNEGVTGNQYQIYRQRGGLLDEMAGSNSPVLQGAARDMRNALDEAFARQAHGADGEALRTARQQYRALQTVKPLADKAPSGNVSPGLVLGAVLREYGSPSNAGNLGVLGRVGSAYLKAQPSSGTSERSIWRSMINKPFSEGIPAAANAAVSLPVSAFATRSLNRAINSPEMRARLLAEALREDPTNAANLARTITGAQ